MIAKRYDFDCITSDYLLGASLCREEVADGDYVLHSDYAFLLARHNALRHNTKVIINAYRENRKKYNALVEAVAKYLALRETQRMKCVDDMTSAEYTRYYEQLSAARAEVDRLIATDKE